MLEIVKQFEMMLFFSRIAEKELQRKSIVYIKFVETFDACSFLLPRIQIQRSNHQYVDEIIVHLHITGKTTNSDPSLMNGIW